MLGALLFAAAVSAASGPADVAGTWRTPTDHGLVRISHCGRSVCGVLLWSDKLKQNPALTDVHNHDAALRARPLRGLQLFSGFTGTAGAWRGGAIYNPRDGGLYHASLELQGPDRLAVTGCLVALLCRTQVWDRAPSNAADR